MVIVVSVCVMAALTSFMLIFSSFFNEVLAPLMGHTEYETTQKYYIHVSSKQKKDELHKIQQKDIQNYLGKENKNLIHLQNNISNLQEIQKEDITHYLELNDETLNILKCFIKQLQ